MPDLRANDFSGGETDRWRENNDPRFYKEAKNLYITERRTLETRPGYAPYSTTQRPYMGQVVQKVWHHFTRNPNSGQDYTTKYQTFVTSNSAVRVNENTDTDPEIVVTDQGNNKATISTYSQGNYVRINDNEFLLFPVQGHPQKFYRSGIGGSQWSYVNLGLPRYFPTLNAYDLVPGNGTGSNNWIYAIVLKHTYQIYEPGSGFITKVVRGAPTFSDRVLGTNQAAIDIPAFNVSNPSNDWVDSDGEFGYVGGDFADPALAANDFGLVIELYRTTDNGTIFYKVSEQINLNGFATADATSDATLVTREQLYTTGGVTSNEMTNDRVNFGTWANDALWLFSSSRGWQSKVGIYDAVPGSYVFSVREGELITAANTIDVYPVVGTTLGVYRIEGIVDDLGRGTHRVRTISEEHGVLSNKTTVRAKNKIFFWSDDGIYETNGYQAAKVTSHYDDRYKQIVSVVGTILTSTDADMLHLADGAYDNVNERVCWIYPAQDGDRYNTKTLVLHLKYKNEEGYAITSGELSHNAVSISAAGGSFFLTTEDGSIIQEDPERYNDVSAGSGDTRFIWKYVTNSYSFGTTRMAKWFTRLIMTFQGKGTTLTARVLEDTDESESFRDLFSISQLTKPTGQHLLKRWFKRGRLRGKYKQVQITNEGSTLPEDEKVELTDMTIVYAAPGEGITESGRT